MVLMRFADPRVHFALNCASGGCPRLPRAAFRDEELDAQLDKETRSFLAEEHNFHIDHTKRRITLSALFEWYATDFLTSAKSANILDYLAQYVPPE